MHATGQGSCQYQQRRACSATSEGVSLLVRRQARQQPTHLRQWAARVLQLHTHQHHWYSGVASNNMHCRARKAVYNRQLAGFAVQRRSPLGMPQERMHTHAHNTYGHTHTHWRQREGTRAPARGAPQVGRSAITHPLPPCRRSLPRRRGARCLHPPARAALPHGSAPGRGGQSAWAAPPGTNRGERCAHCPAAAGRQPLRHPRHHPPPTRRWRAPLHRQRAASRARGCACEATELPGHWRRGSGPAARALVAARRRWRLLRRHRWQRSLTGHPHAPPDAVPPQQRGSSPA